MAKPCQLCGVSTDLMEIPNPKMAGFFLRPYNEYPICQDCHIPLSEGNLDGLVGILARKWKVIQSRRKEERSTRSPHEAKTIGSTPMPAIPNNQSIKEVTHDK